MHWKIPGRELPSPLSSGPRRPEVFVMFLKKLAFGFASSLLVTIVACGGADQSISDFNKGENGKGGFGNGKDKSGTENGGLGGDGTPVTSPDLAACATQSAFSAASRPAVSCRG